MPRHVYIFLKLSIPQFEIGIGPSFHFVTEYSCHEEKRQWICVKWEFLFIEL